MDTNKPGSEESHLKRLEKSFTGKRTKYDQTAGVTLAGEDVENSKKKMYAKAKNLNLEIMPVNTIKPAKRQPDGIVHPESLDGLTGSGATLAVLGGTGSGKSTIIANMLFNPNFPFSKYFDYIAYCTPAADTYKMLTALNTEYDNMHLFLQFTEAIKNDLAKIGRASCRDRV